MKNKVFLLVCLGALLALPLLSAALTINVPVANTNYTTTLAVNVTSSLNHTGNVTCWYNASGGAASTTTGNLTGTIANTTSNQADFTKSVDLTAITDADAFNVSCTANNGSDTESTSVAGITFDSTDPVVTLFVDLDGETQTYGRLIEYSCTTTDALDSGPTEVFSVTHPTDDPTSSTTLTLQSTYLQFDDTDYAGDYVFTCTSTDYTGNEGSDSATVTVDSLGRLVISDSPSSGGNYTWLWVVLIAVGLYMLLSKKK